MSGRARTVVFVIVANVAGLAALLAATEGVLRLLHVPHDDRWTPSENAVARFDPELGWAYRPGLSKVVDFEGRQIPVHFDERGVRVPDPEAPLDPDRPSVLFVGGSYTMGHGLRAEDTFAEQLGRLSEAAGYQMVNLGVQAYGTDQALLSLQRHIKDFDARAVVYTFIESHRRRNENVDRRILFPGGKFVGTKPRFALDADGRPVLRDRPVRYEDHHSSYLLDLLRIRLAARRDHSLEAAERLTRALILAMDETCRDHGVRFVLVDWRWSERDWDGLADLPVTRIDTLQDAPRSWEHLRLPRDDHPNARACAHVARLLRDRLVADGVFR